MADLTGKVAAVTGAAMGIGKAAAAALAAAGAAVILADIDAATGEQTAAEIRMTGARGVFQHTDVGKSEAVQEMVNVAVHQFGGLDILVNNAAVALPGSVVDIDEDTWNRVLNTNLTSVWRGMKFAIPQMIARGGGAIINVSSVQSLLGFQGWSAYAAAKGAINSLTQQAAAEYSKHNIRINAVLPGTIMTPMNEKIFDTVEDPQKLIETWNAMHPLGRFGQADEVGRAIVFLASEEASFITGTLLRVDGGSAIKGD